MVACKKKQHAFGLVTRINIRLATNQDRMDEYMQYKGVETIGVNVEVLTPEEVVEHWPGAA